MKKTPLILSIISLVGVVALAICMFVCCPKGQKASASESASELQAGAIAYFNLDTILEQYDMANDLRSVAQTKFESIDQELSRRASKLEKDVKAFQDKLDKGLLTRSVAEAQNQKLAQQQNELNNYAAIKQQEAQEEQAVMMNNIADAIKTYIDQYNEQKQFAMIISTQGGILPTPVVAGDAALDITEELLEGLNAEYIKEKSKK